MRLCYLDSDSAKVITVPARATLILRTGAYALCEREQTLRAETPFILFAFESPKCFLHLIQLWHIFLFIVSMSQSPDSGITIRPDNF